MLKYKNLKFKFVKYLVIFSVSMNLSSCQTDVSLVSKKIIGQWDISEFTYKNRNCLDDLLLNYIMFYNNNKIAIPEIYNYLAEDKENNSKWDIKIDTNKNVRVKLSCKNPIFNGDYKVTFFKNGN